MQVTVQLPDELARHLVARGDLSRLALEALAAEEYRHGNLSRRELRRVLNLKTRFELDDFLKSHNVGEEPTIEEIQRDVSDLEHLGF